MEGPVSAEDGDSFLPDSLLRFFEMKLKFLSRKDELSRRLDEPDCTPDERTSIQQKLVKIDKHLVNPPPSQEMPEALLQFLDLKNKLLRCKSELLCRLDGPCAADEKERLRRNLINIDELEEGFSEMRQCMLLMRCQWDPARDSCFYVIPTVLAKLPTFAISRDNRAHVQALKEKLRGKVYGLEWIPLEECRRVVAYVLQLIPEPGIKRVSWEMEIPGMPKQTVYTKLLRYTGRKIAPDPILLEFARPLARKGYLAFHFFDEDQSFSLSDLAESVS